MANRRGKKWKLWQIFLGSKITAGGGCSHEKRHLLHERKARTNVDSIFKSKDISLLTKVQIVKATVFPVVVWIWELDHKEGWELKNWCFWTVMLVKILESPLDCKVIKPVNLRGNQPWIVTGRTVAEALILWSPDAKSQLTGKIPHAGEDFRQKEKGEGGGKELDG